MLQPRFRALLLAGLLSPHTVAQPLPVDPGDHSVSVAIRVFGGAQCIRRPEVARGVEAWLGSDVLPTAWTVVVLVRDVAVQFSIYENGKLVALRRFDRPPEDCTDFEAALGASIGLSLEALLARRAERAEQAVREDLAAEEATRQEESEGSPLSLTAQITLATDTLIGPARGGHLTFELGSPWEPARPSAFRVRLGVMTLWAEDMSLEAAEDARLSSRLLAARVGACWGSGRPAWRLQACTDAMAGHVSGRGVGELRGLGARLPWAAWGLGLEGRLWLFDPVALSAGVQGNLQLARPTFRVVAESGQDVEAYRVPPLGFMFHAGATWSYR